MKAQGEGEQEDKNISPLLAPLQVPKVLEGAGSN